ncbi:MAG: hypothetical protein P8R54_11195 [Myxococcota bacterium]|nr:hypothetical protein [Myxococcota bacterium]
MIKINASPLVIAAALGLLGPAALLEDDETEGLGGLWERTSASREAGLPDVSLLPGLLGDRIQLLPLDDSYVLDEGNGRDSGMSSWSVEPVVLQELNVANAEITREFHTEDDTLKIRTVVSQEGEVLEYSDCYTRVG